MSDLSYWSDCLKESDQSDGKMGQIGKMSQIGKIGLIGRIGQKG